MQTHPVASGKLHRDVGSPHNKRLGANDLPTRTKHNAVSGRQEQKNISSSSTCCRSGGPERQTLGRALPRPPTRSAAWPLRGRR
eukprot:scaffold349_cov352-Prasinococcus_capsulatus_cf.AAC.8